MQRENQVREGAGLFGPGKRGVRTKKESALKRKLLDWRSSSLLLAVSGSAKHRCGQEKLQKGTRA